MKFQLKSWTCGPSSTVNALRCFGIKVDESKVQPVAGTIPPSKCAHCRAVKAALEERECEESKWSCPCEECKEVRRLWRRHCDAGTSEQGVVRALKFFSNLKVNEYGTNDKHHAWQWLHGSLIHGRVVILCARTWSHWVTVIGSLGDRVIVFDSMNTKSNKAEHGIHVLTKEQLIKQWWNAAAWVGNEKRMYAISVGK